MRIQFKKLRYTCEVYAELYGPAMKRFLRDLKAAQESLGSWNDHRVLRDYVAEAMEADPPSVARQGMPVLCNVVDDLVHSLLEAFRGSSAEFFSPSRTKETRKLMRGVRAQCCDFKTSPLV